VALVKRYGSHEAVAGIDLEVRRGEIFAFLGPNSGDHEQHHRQRREQAPGPPCPEALQVQPSVHAVTDRHANDRHSRPASRNVGKAVT
jgi:ABC-type arginine transport system ATPase subunit